MIPFIFFIHQLFHVLLHVSLIPFSSTITLPDTSFRQRHNEQKNTKYVIMYITSGHNILHPLPLVHQCCQGLLTVEGG